MIRSIFVINFFRWIKEHFFVWLLLVGIYSLGAAIVTQRIVTLIFEKEISFFGSWFLVCAVLMVPWVFEVLPDIPIRLSWKVKVTEFYGIYLNQELRRLTVWLVLIAAGVAGPFLFRESLVFWIFLAQLNTQRGLYGIRRWRRLFHVNLSDLSGSKLLGAFCLSQVAQYFVVFFCFVLVAWGIQIEPAKIFQAAVAGMMAVLAGSAVALEGDSGNPLIVNLISYSVGTVVGLMSLMSLWVVPFIVYVAYRMILLAENRLRSVELEQNDFTV